jgi:hypothetical protein
MPTFHSSDTGISTNKECTDFLRGEGVSVGEWVCVKVDIGLN